LTETELKPVRDDEHIMGLTPPVHPDRRAQIPYEILGNPNLSMTAKCLYGAMERYWFGSGECFAARSRLARDIGRGRTVLDRGLKELGIVPILVETAQAPIVDIDARNSA
jgi:hypothetical protein